MKPNTPPAVPWSFWAIGSVALLWNAMGSLNFVVQLDVDTVAAMPETHRAIIEARPVWATAGFALGVFGGALGCVLLLLRKSAAYYLFIASLLGVVATTVHTLGVAGSGVRFSAFEVVMMVLMSPVVAALLVAYAKRAENRGWTG